MKPHLMFIGDEVLTYNDWPGLTDFPVNTIGYWPTFKNEGYSWIEVQISSGGAKVWDYIPLEDVPKEYRVKALLMT